MKETTDIDNQGLDDLFERYRQSPDSYVFVLLADACRKIRRIDEALEVCRSGIERHPNYASGYVVKGKCHYDLQEHDAAKETFNHVLSLDENNLVALKYLGMIEAEQGQYDSARNYFQHILQLDPDNKVIKDTMRQVDEREQMGTSEDPARAGAPVTEDSDEYVAETARAVGGLETSDELATLTLADIFASQGYQDKAVRICEELLRKDPANKAVREKMESLGVAVTQGDTEHTPDEARDPDTRSNHVVEHTTEPGAAMEDPNAVDLDGEPGDAVTAEPVGHGSGAGDASAIELGDGVTAGPGEPGSGAGDASAIELGDGVTAGPDEPGSGAGNASAIELGGAEDAHPGDTSDARDQERDGRETVELTGPVDDRGSIQLPHAPNLDQEEGTAKVASEPDEVTLGESVAEAVDAPASPEAANQGLETTVGFSEIASEANGTGERETGRKLQDREKAPKSKTPAADPPETTRRPIDEKESITHFKRWLRQMDD